MALLGERLERPAYAISASGLLYGMAALWRPLGGECYHLTGWSGAAARLVQAAGLIVAVSALRHTDGLALIGWLTNLNGSNRRHARGIAHHFFCRSMSRVRC